MAMKKFDGQTFGRLTVIREVTVAGKPRRLLCRCICGTQKEINCHRVTTGYTKSCGCIAREAFGARFRTHGKSGTRTHRIWKGMHSRCYNPKEQSYKYYGEIGIGICDRWRKSYANFLDDMGECPDGMSIERRDRSLGYEPGNCCWATQREQQANRRDTVRVTINGETKALSHWAEAFGVHRDLVRKRVRNGWPVAAALTIAWKR